MTSPRRTTSASIPRGSRDVAISVTSAERCNTASASTLCLIEQVFAVVEHDDELALGEELHECVLRGHAGRCRRASMTARTTSAPSRTGTKGTNQQPSGKSGAIVAATASGEPAVADLEDTLGGEQVSGGGALRGRAIPPGLRRRRPSRGPARRGRRPSGGRLAVDSWAEVVAVTLHRLTGVTPIRTLSTAAPGHEASASTQPGHERRRPRRRRREERRPRTRRRRWRRHDRRASRWRYKNNPVMQLEGRPASPPRPSWSLRVDPSTSVNRNVTVPDGNRTTNRSFARPGRHLSRSGSAWPGGPRRVSRAGFAVRSRHRRGCASLRRLPSRARARERGARVSRFGTFRPLSGAESPTARAGRPRYSCNPERLGPPQPLSGVIASVRTIRSKYSLNRCTLPSSMRICVTYVCR